MRGLGLGLGFWVRVRVRVWVRVRVGVRIRVNLDATRGNGGGGVTGRIQTSGKDGQTLDRLGPNCAHIFRMICERTLVEKHWPRETPGDNCNLGLSRVNILVVGGSTFHPKSGYTNSEGIPISG